MINRTDLRRSPQELHQVWFVEQERQNAELHNSETPVCTFAPRAARWWWAPTEGWGQEGHEVLNEVGNEDRQAGCRVHLILIINSSLHPPFTPGPPPSISATKIKLGQRFKELPENISHPKLNQLDLRIIKDFCGTLLCSFSAVYGVYMTRIASSWN